MGEAQSCVWRGEAVNPVVALKSRIACLLTLFYPSEKMIPCLVNTSEDSLYHLAVHVIVCRSQLFQGTRLLSLQLEAAGFTARFDNI